MSQGRQDGRRGKVGHECPTKCVWKGRLHESIKQGSSRHRLSRYNKVRLTIFVSRLFNNHGALIWSEAGRRLSFERDGVGT